MDAVDGRYELVGLIPGAYIVQEINPPGFTSTTPDKVLARVMANTRVEINFGDTILSTPVPTATATLSPLRLYFPLL